MKRERGERQLGFMPKIEGSVTVIQYEITPELIDALRLNKPLPGGRETTFLPEGYEKVKAAASRSSEFIAMMLKAFTTED